MNRDNGFELASIYDTILAPSDHYITLLIIQICIVADKVQWIRMKYPTFKF